MYAVLTVGGGFNLSYDAAIRHYRYDISDSKQENIAEHFDDAVKKIGKGEIYCYL